MQTYDGKTQTWRETMVLVKNVNRVRGDAIDQIRESRLECQCEKCRRLTGRMSDTVTKNPFISEVCNYRELKAGEEVLPGDEGWTWLDEDCTILGWYVFKISDFGVGDPYDPNEMVTIRRKVEV